MRNFPVVVKTDCKNIHRIYLLKQKMVQEEGVVVYECSDDFKL